MTKTIYLAGPISGHFKSGAMSWRDQAAAFVFEHFNANTHEHEYKFVVKDPLRGKGLDKFRGKIKDAYDGESPLRTPQGIFYRDFNDVFTCDLVFANFSDTATRRVPRPGHEAMDIQLASIGTVMELGWAYAFRKPVILVLPKNNVHDHTFVKRTAVVRVETLEEGLWLIPEILG
jgi:nucleoside 2-deoxyribosyltransferase